VRFVIARRRPTAITVPPQIDAEGAKALGEGLAVNTALTTLKYAAPLEALAFTVSSR